MWSVNRNPWHTRDVTSIRRDDLETSVESWLATLRSDNTRAAYRRDLVVFGQWVRSARLQPRKVTVAQVEQFADHCTDAGESDATVRRRMAAVTSFYRHAGTTWAVVNPGVTADRPAATPEAAAVVLSGADAEALWRAALSLGPKTAVLVSLVLHDGFKAHELLRLDADDLHRSGGVCSVRVPGRAGAARCPSTRGRRQRCVVISVSAAPVRCCTATTPRESEPGSPGTASTTWFGALRRRPVSRHRSP